MQSNAALVSSDGMVYRFVHQVNASSIKDNICGYFASNNYCFNITVDINGSKGPNRWGFDTFVFEAGQDRIIPRGALGSYGQNLCDPDSSDSVAPGWQNGSACSAWVLQEGNLDYLKCVKGNQKYCNQKYTFN